MNEKNKKEKIMRAAEKLSANRRFHEVTLDEVAQEAQVGKGTIYRFFKDKDDLFFQAAASGFEEIAQVIDELKPMGEPFEKRLATVCYSITSYIFERRQAFRLMQIEEGRVIWDGGDGWSRWLEKRRRMIDALARVIGEGRDQGVLRKDIPLDSLANLLLGMLRTRARYLAECGDLRQKIDLVVSMFLFGAAGSADNNNMLEGKGDV